MVIDVYKYPSLNTEFEQSYLTALMDYLYNKDEFELRRLLREAKCSIQLINKYSVIRPDTQGAIVNFYIPPSQLDIPDEAKTKKLVTYCNHIMPKDFGYDIADVQFSAIIPYNGAVIDTISIDGTKNKKVMTFSSFVSNEPDKPVDPNLVSIMMPFNANFNKVSETIKTACSSLALDCKRADDIWNNSVIIQDIFDLIYNSSIVIVDFSGKNPNVLYEAGIAHTLGKDVIPITQHIDDIPFDLKHHRVIIYLNNSEGLDELRKKLETRLTSLRQLKVH